MSSRRGSIIAHRVAFAGNLRVPMRDGITLAGDLYRPADDKGRPMPGKFPTILERTPYDRTRQFQWQCGQYFAARGYNWFVVDCRGRYDSEGEFHFYNAHHEGLDGYDTVEWVAKQPWSNGKIGTTGLSFAGSNQQALAVSQPPHLTTQVLLDCSINYWRRTLRNNGAFAEGIFAPYVFRMAISGHEARANPEVRRALEAYLADIDNWIRKLPLRPGATPLALAPSYERWYFDISTQGDYTRLYQTPMTNLQNFIDDYPDIPLLMASSWYGNRHAWGNFEKHCIFRKNNKAPAQLIVGPWLHQEDFMEQRFAGNTNFGNDVYINLNDYRLRWFDQFMKGMNTGMLDEPDIRIFVMGGGSGLRDYDNRMQHGGHWRAIESWPPPDAKEEKLYLGADGGFSRKPAKGAVAPLEYVFNPADPVPTIGGAVQNPRDVGNLIHGGGYDQRGQKGFALTRDRATLASRPDVLVFRTEPLKEALEVTGNVYVDLWVRSSAVDTDFTAKLVDECPPNQDYPEGFALVLVEEIQRMSYRDGRLKRELIEPGQIYKITLGPMLISNLFAPGHRIRLDISSSSFPQFDVNTNTGADFDKIRGAVTARNAVFMDAERPSVMRLPVRKAAR